MTLATLPAADLLIRPPSSRERLLDAAVALFCRDGYTAVSVEDLACVAGVSRMTFYRQFAGKAALAAELFEHNWAQATPRLTAIATADFYDRAVVRRWIADLFAADDASRRLLRVFLQASIEGDFAETGHRRIETLIADLGRGIPAFAADRHDPAQRRRWLEAWLLLYELLDQSNHAALHSGVATDPLVIDILADRFTAFVTR